MLLIPAAIAASCAFMLPVATPVPAVIFGSGYVTISQEAKSGLELNILSIIIAVVATWSAGNTDC